MKSRNETRALAILSAGAMLWCGPALGQENDALSLFKEMSDYLTAQKTISANYDATLEIVTSDLEKIRLASSGSLAAERPNKVRMTRTGGFADVEMVFDGEHLSFYGKNLNIFTTENFKGTIDDLIDTLRFDYGLDIPAADLLSSAPDAFMTSDVIDAKSLGSGVIHGQYCSHLLFRTPEVDWEVWVSESGQPYPCRFTITSKMITMAPTYTIEFTDWKTGADVAANDFQLKTADGAKEIPADELRGAIDEVALIGGKGGSR